ncbi:alcohol dehydrogenase catalytic domain-containing protein [Ornithinimicrobium cerasi]|uniref:alcohol dehydrogenase catalytic domain-containing protein n=1 Tax=Ornithinimicrobium cerasi TaxID=2248773 RepID=UPI001F31C2F1|nr:alcohol dehydrogenase catalytic domain-containing protein [Ornithinimicrobium cerasi]
MRAVVKTGPGKGLTYRQDWPDPRPPGPGEVLIKVAAASLCGTDREIVEDTPAARSFNLATPVVIGHEGSGTVQSVGEGVTRVQAGDRVALESHMWCGQCHACRTGHAHACPRTRIVGMHIDGLFAEYTVVAEQVCVKLPDSIDLDTGALMESAGVAVHAVQRADYAVAGGAVLVNGCGPVGLVAGEIARVMGATQVVAVDPNPFRRGQADSRGFTTVDPAQQDVLDAATN